MKGFSGRETWKVKWSFSMFQWTPRERCDGSTSRRRSRSLMFLARSSAGKASMTRTELETTLCRRKFAVATMAWAFLMRVIASFFVGREVSPSST